MTSMNTPEPQITTIITTYKRPKLLKRAIESVLHQTYSSFQVCVYDNASGDETAEVVAELKKRDSRVKYHCHSENIGMMNNYQYAFEHVNTPYFSFLSDDDLVLPTFLETTLKGFEKHPEVMFSAASTLIVNEKNEIVADPLAHWKREGLYALPEGPIEMVGRWIPPTAILFRKQVLEGITIATSNQILWDCDLLLKIAARFAFFISKEPCGVFLNHAQSFSAHQGSKNWRAGILKMMHEIENCLSIEKSARVAIVERLNEYLKEHTSVSIRHFLVWGQIEEASHSVDIYLENYEMRFEIALLAVLVKMCVRFPKAYFLVEIIKKVKKFIKRNNIEKVKAKFFST